MKKIISITLLTFCLHANANANANNNLHGKEKSDSSFIINNDYILLQKPDDRLYLINKKYNHPGCKKILSGSVFEWNIDARKYVDPVQGVNEGISTNVLKRFKYIILTNTPLEPKVSISKQIQEKKESGEMYCEALIANMK